MEVDLIRLRDSQGRKLSKEAIAAAVPLHGYLQLSYWRLANGREDKVIKQLILKSASDATNRPLATLVGAEQTRLKGTQMVYVGTETVAGVEHQQAWWCRLAPRPSGR